jgi:hypothetical protein
VVPGMDTSWMRQDWVLADGKNRQGGFDGTLQYVDAQIPKGGGRNLHFACCGVKATGNRKSDAPQTADVCHAIVLPWGVRSPERR